MTDKKMILSIFLAALSLTACGDKNNDPSPLPPPSPDTEIPGNNSGSGMENVKTKPVWMMTTSSNKSYDLSISSIRAQSGEGKSSETLSLNPADQYQEIDGFGSAITGAAAENLLKMSLEERTKFLKETFSMTEGYGFSYIRVPIGCSDFSRTEYTLNDKEGIENFALTKEETDYLIPVIKEILAINPDLKVLGSPWTAPRWMKVNNIKDLKPWNSWNGGYLNPKYYTDYGLYFVKWIKAFEDNGIPIYAVTPQNEPLNPGNSASMVMPWEQERDFIKTGLGPQLDMAGLGTKIYCFDHNYNYDNISDQMKYPLRIYEDPEASKYIAGAAYHNYGGNVSEMSAIHRGAPSKELVFTESTDGEWNDDGLNKASVNVQRRLISAMEDIALGTTNNWSRGFILWNLVLDEQHGPFSPTEGSCKTGYGTVDLLNNGTIRKNAYYYIIAHTSSVAMPGGVRIGMTGNVENIVSSAFLNPDGSYGLVLLNKNSVAVSITVSEDEWEIPVTLPALSVVSLKW